MGKKTILVDDLDGSTLPESTQGLTVTVNGKKHEVFLSARNTERFMDFLNGQGTLTSPVPASRRTAVRASTTDTYGYNNAEVREWAQATGYQHNDKPLGAKGRIPQGVFDAYHEYKTGQ